MRLQLKKCKDKCKQVTPLKLNGENASQKGKDKCTTKVKINKNVSQNT